MKAISFAGLQSFTGFSVQTSLVWRPKIIKPLGGLIEEIRWVENRNKPSLY